MNALGMIETNSIPLGVNAADAMLKAATVELVAAQPVCAGKYIAIVTGELKEHGVNSERYQGYLDALREAGIRPLKRNLFEGYVDYRYGAEAAQNLAKNCRGVTAVFATADITAVGLINGLHEAGISVPGDISVIGFDDAEYAKMCFPGLTTIRQNIMEKGRQAARLMIEAVQNHGLPRVERIIPMELIERGTVMEVYGN